MSAAGASGAGRAGGAETGGAGTGGAGMGAAGISRSARRMLGDVPQYRLVTLCLLALAVLSGLLSAAGLLPFTPLGIVVSVIVGTAATTTTSWLFGLAFRRRPHTESSVITGLLLFFLFWPSTEPGDLAALAVAGVFAGASKYLLAWRGRHLLNPTATGATLAALVMPTSAVWWIATAPLLPAVAIAALLVVYRLRRFGLVAVFIAVSAVVLIARALLAGFGPLDAISATFTSYPVLFFAAFMLTEPITLPPRRWQQLTVAAVVGALFPLPFVFGSVALSFEFALVLGNLLAFALVLGQRRSITLALEERRQLSPNLWEFRFRAAPRRGAWLAARAGRVSFLPGQYAELTLGHSRADRRGARRMFTIASAPGDDTISFALRTTDPGSSFKRALLALDPGNDAVSVATISGDFVLPRDERMPVLMLAGGIGITPFLSQLRADRASGIQRDTVLVWVVAEADQLAFATELATERVLLVSPASPAELPPGWRWLGPIGEGRATVSATELARAIPDAAARATFVSGSPVFVDQSRRELRTLGVRRVVTDYFSGY